MGLMERRKILKLGKGTNAVSLPITLKVGETCSMGINRLCLIDPRGEIDPSQLLDILEKYVEPHIWSKEFEVEQESEQKI